MGKPLLFGAITTATVLGSVFVFSSNLVNAQQQPCPYVFQTPASESRQIEIPEFGVKFQIPANYRTKKEKNHSDKTGIRITIINPGALDVIKCSQNGDRQNRSVQFAGETLWQREIYIDITPIRHGNVNLTDGIYPSKSGLGYGKILNISDAIIANQKAIVFIKEYGRPDVFIHARFFSPDKRYLVDINKYIGYEGKLDSIFQKEKPIFQQVVSTFEFN